MATIAAGPAAVVGSKSKWVLWQACVNSHPSKTKMMISEAWHIHVADLVLNSTAVDLQL